MADLTDSEIDKLHMVVQDIGYESIMAMVRLDIELRRRRAMVLRLEEWAGQLETPGIDGPGVGQYIAAELRNRMKGT